MDLHFGEHLYFHIRTCLICFPTGLYCHTTPIVHDIAEVIPNVIWLSVRSRHGERRGHASKRRNGACEKLRVTEILDTI